jgi:hypothetical protein
MEQRRVLHDYVTRLTHLASAFERMIADPHVGCDRGPAALRAEVGKRLHVTACLETGLGEHIGGNHIALSTPTIDSYFGNLCHWWSASSYAQSWAVVS